MKATYLLLFLIVLSSCNSIDLVENWKNPTIDSYSSNKVLIVGMTQNIKARKQFESTLKEEYESRGVEAVMSLDRFDANMTTEHKTAEELKALENALIADGFDTILFTKVIGVEDKIMYKENFDDYDRTYKNFKEDYLMYQDAFYNPDYYYEYSIYHSVTSLYCICPTKDRELIWKGYIDITDPQSVKEIVNDYTRLIVVALEEQLLINPKTEINTTQEDMEVL